VRLRLVLLVSVSTRGNYGDVLRRHSVHCTLTVDGYSTAGTDIGDLHIVRLALQKAREDTLSVFLSSPALVG